MNIKYKTYKLIQQESGFDLIETIQSHKIGTGTLSHPNGEIYDKDVTIGYNMKLDTCFNRIVHLELLKRDSTVELRKFRDEFKKLHKEIKDILKLN